MIKSILFTFWFAHSILATAVVKRQDDSAQSIDPKYGPFTMTLPLDHFNNGTSKTFENRYWINADYYASNGPIILVNFGEGGVNKTEAYNMLFENPVSRLTQDLKGVLVSMEHRFYGESGLTLDFFDNTREDMKFFDSEQALADMAQLVRNVKIAGVPPVPETKVIVLGCSYPGSLAAWSKLLYPDLYFAAVAASAPIQAQADFHEYYNPIMEYNDPECIHAYENVISYIDGIMFGSSADDKYEMKKLFSSENLSDGNFAVIIQADIGEVWSYSTNITYNGFDKKICSLFNTTNPESPEVVQENLLNYANYVNNYSLSYCVDKETVDISTCLLEDTFNSLDNDSAAWTWQTCNEFGSFQIAPPKGQPSIVSRLWDLNISVQQCQQTFKDYDVPAFPFADEINRKRGGWDLELEKTIWMDGEWDSWRYLSKNGPHASKALGRDSISIIIPHETHCSNYLPLDDDSPSNLWDAYNKQLSTLKSWLAEESPVESSISELSLVEPGSVGPIAVGLSSSVGPSIGTIHASAVPASSVDPIEEYSSEEDSKLC